MIELDETMCPVCNKLGMPILNSESRHVCRDCGCIINEDSRFVSSPKRNLQETDILLPYYKQQNWKYFDLHQLSAKEREKFARLTRVSKKMSYNTSFYAYRQAFIEIGRICAVLGVKNHKPELYDIFTEIFNSAVPGTMEKHIDILVPVIIFHYCRNSRRTITIREIVKISKCSRPQFQKVFISTLSYFNRPTFNEQVRRYVFNHVNKSGITRKICQTAFDIFERDPIIFGGIQAKLAAGSALVVSYFLLTESSNVSFHALLKRLNLDGQSVRRVLNKYAIKYHGMLFSKVYKEMRGLLND